MNKLPPAVSDVSTQVATNLRVKQALSKTLRELLGRITKQPQVLEVRMVIINILAGLQMKKLRSTSISNPLWKNEKNRDGEKMSNTKQNKVQNVIL